MIPGTKIKGSWQELSTRLNFGRPAIVRWSSAPGQFINRRPSINLAKYSIDIYQLFGFANSVLPSRSSPICVIVLAIAIQRVYFVQN